MKNKLKSLGERIRNSPFYANVLRPLRWVLGSLSHNLGYKLLSLLLAILLWNYVITTDTSITRNKTLYNLTATVNGFSTLTQNKLALPENPEEALSGISVVVEAPQADYTRVSADNTQVTLDLSGVRQAGTQQVPLRATSAYGRIRSINPQTLALDFDSLDSRNVAVNCVLVGEQEDYWYNISRINPSMLTVSGAASVVQSIASARVVVDVRGMTDPGSIALPYVLLDASGKLISQDMLNCSTSSVSVSVDIYPCRDIPVSVDRDSVITGEPAEGYEVRSVSIQPQSIQVAAELELLNSLEQLVVEPVSVQGATQSFTAKSSVSQLSDFKNVSSGEVYVSVTVAEEQVQAYIDNVRLIFSGKADNLIASYDQLGVTVSGPRSAVEALAEEGVVAYVDVKGLEEGYYILSPKVDEDSYEGMTFLSEAASVTLTAIDDGELADDSEPLEEGEAAEDGETVDESE